LSDDLLDRVLRTALAEGALGPDRVESLAAGLRERARLILDERLGPVEERAAALERESRWRQEVIAGLAAEAAWKTRAMAELEEDGQRLRAEAVALKAEMDALRRASETARTAHDRLLAHHRGILRDVVAALEGLEDGLPWGYRRVRRRLLEMAASLRRETG
jgi:hypothetical protein